MSLSARVRRVVLSVAAAGMLAACVASEGSSTADAGAAGEHVRPLVVATTPILGDIVGRVTGDAASVEVLMGPGQDPHTFALSARQRARMDDAALVVANGLGLEEGLVDALDEVARAGTPVLSIAEHLDPLPVGGHADDPHGGDHSTGDHAGHDHGPLDPHVWLDAARMAAAPAVIANHLDEVAPGPWQAHGARAATDLVELDRRLAVILSEVPTACRVLVTNHDAMGYFAHRHGFEVAATVLPGTSTDIAANARDMAALVARLDDLEVPAIFVEDTSSTRLAEVLAGELHGVAVVSVALGTLGAPGTATDDYAGLMQTLATTVASTLSGCAHDGHDGHDAHAGHDAHVHADESTG